MKYDNLTPEQALSRVCREAGSRPPLWTQGAGGNVSVKQGDRLFIKASGLRLDEVASDRGVAKLALRPFLAKLADVGAENDYAESLKAAAESPDARPSMETGFHALMPRRWVTHIHSLPGILMGEEYRRAPEQILSWLASNTAQSAAFLPPLRPGLELSLAVRAHRDTQIVFLQSHGVILQDSETPRLAEWSDLEIRYCRDRGHDLLLRLCESEKTLEEAKAMGAKLGPIPLRIYLPDTAVFIDRMRKVTVPAGGDTLTLHPDAWRTDRNAAELFLATQLLHHASPPPVEVPVEISATLADLPTEKFRRKINGH